MAFVTGQRITADALNVLFDKPIGRLIQQPASQALADNTAVALTFGTGSTVYDTHSFHSESSNTTRVTPTKAGYYRFFGTGFFAAETTPVTATVNFRQNGATNLAGAWRYPGSTISFSAHAQVDILMNGSTDYMELMLLQDSAGANTTNTSVQFSSVLEWEFIRSQ